MHNEMTELLEKNKYGITVGPVHTILNTGALISVMNNSPEWQYPKTTMFLTPAKVWIEGR